MQKKPLRSSICRYINIFINLNQSHKMPDCSVWLLPCAWVPSQKTKEIKHPAAKCKSLLSTHQLLGWQKTKYISSWKWVCVCNHAVTKSLHLSHLRQCLQFSLPDVENSEFWEGTNEGIVLGVYKIMSSTEKVNELFPVVLSHSSRTKRYPIKQTKTFRTERRKIFISVIKTKTKPKQPNKQIYFSRGKKKYISRIFTARNKPVIWLKDRNKKPWETWNQCISPSSATEGGIKRLVAAYIQTILAFSILLLEILTVEGKEENVLLDEVNVLCHLHSGY